MGGHPVARTASSSPQRSSAVTPADDGMCRDGVARERRPVDHQHPVPLSRGQHRRRDPAQRARRRSRRMAGSWKLSGSDGALPTDSRRARRGASAEPPDFRCPAEWVISLRGAGARGERCGCCARRNAELDEDVADVPVDVLTLRTSSVAIALLVLPSARGVAPAAPVRSSHGSPSRRLRAISDLTRLKFVGAPDPRRPSVPPPARVPRCRRRPSGRRPVRSQNTRGPPRRGPSPVLPHAERLTQPGQCAPGHRRGRGPPHHPARAAVALTGGRSTEPPRSALSSSEARRASLEASSDGQHDLDVGWQELDTLQRVCGLVHVPVDRRGRGVALALGEPQQRQPRLRARGRSERLRLRRVAVDGGHVCERRVEPAVLGAGCSSSSRMRAARWNQPLAIARSPRRMRGDSSPTRRPRASPRVAGLPADG